MKSVNVKKFGIYVVACIAIGLVCNLLFVTNSLLYSLINSLFLGGMAVLLYGLFRYVIGVGFFDIFIYSHKKMFRYFRFSKVDPLDETKKLGSYHDYKMENIKKNDCLEPLLAGGIFTAIAICVTLADILVI